MLTYADRLKSMRETKIRHTLEKKKQNGYTDLDDFGTVPISSGYEVTPWYNSSNGSFYGCDGMSENFCRVINAHEPYVDPIVQRWCILLFSPSTINTTGEIAGKKNKTSRNYIVSEKPLFQAVFSIFTCGCIPFSCINVSVVISYTRQFLNGFRIATIVLTILVGV